MMKKYPVVLAVLLISFRGQATAQLPEILYPPHNATGVSINPTLKWTIPSWADHSNVHVQKYGSSQYDYEFIGLNVTSIMIGPLDYNTRYICFVVAVGSGGSYEIATAHFITEIRPADLTVASLQVIDSEGPDIAYRLIVTNVGDKATNTKFKNIFYLSQDQTISPVDYRINDWNVTDPLEPGQSKTSWDLTSTVSGVPAGTYYLGVIVDGNDDIDESDESNNTRHADSPLINMSSTNVQQGEQSNTVTAFKLFQNYPNPFNPSTRISFTIPKSDYVDLKVYDISGKEVEVLYDGCRDAGEYSVFWHTRGLPAGIYLYRLKVGDYSETRKLVLQK